jgi:hypothetical protein
MLAVPDLPELVAVIVAEPAATPVTTPLAFTVAAAELFVDQVTVWPVMVLPFWSLTVAVSVVLAPAWIETEGGETVTVVTTGVGGGTAVTVIAAVPDFPELVAVIVADPAATPDTTPLALTVAAAVLLLDQVTVCPVITLPFWSFTVACRDVVLPATTEADVGETVTVVTTGAGGGVLVTVIAAVPDLLELVAVIIAEPAATPLTTPLAFTVATPVLLLDQVTDWPLIVLPFWSFTVACRVTVAPDTTDAEGGDTVTLVTTGGGGSVLPVVVPSAMFETSPKTACAFSVPR